MINYKHYSLFEEIERNLNYKIYAIYCSNFVAHDLSSNNYVIIPYSITNDEFIIGDESLVEFSSITRAIDYIIKIGESICL